LPPLLKIQSLGEIKNVIEDSAYGSKLYKKKKKRVGKRRGEFSKMRRKTLMRGFLKSQFGEDVDSKGTGAIGLTVR